MTTSTFLTLFVIPVTYVLFSKLAKKEQKDLGLDKPIAMILVLACSLLTLNGCALGPQHQKPNIGHKESWKNSRVINSGLRLTHKWWEIFQDPVFNGLEEQAVRNNQDLAIAMANVDKTRALARVNKADLFPDIEANPSAERSRTNATANFPSRTSNLYSLPLDLSYEIDIWGKVR